MGKSKASKFEAEVVCGRGGGGAYFLALRMV
jgi:hypothetical protein